MSLDAWIEVDPGEYGLALALVSPGTRVLPAAGMALPVLTGISTIDRPLSIPGIAAASTSSMSADIDNASGAMLELWSAEPPLRRAARVVTSGGVLFKGVVTAVSAGAAMRLELQAGMDRPLSDNVPLRTSAVWGGWRDVQVLPWVWGRCTLAPIQYSDDQRVFLLADHPIQSVDEVKRDDVPTPAYAWRNAVDSTGRAVALLELAQPLAEGERLSATVRGRMHPESGRLLQSPAEILHDVLANLAGAPVAWADLDDYRSATQAVVLGGLLADNSISVRRAIDDLLQSCAGAWAAAMPGVAIDWPPLPDDAAPAMSVTPLTCTGMQAQASAADIVTAVRVLYDYDHAGKRYQRAIALEAPDAIKTYGRLELEWAAPWLRTPRQAEAIGKRVLSYMARPRWRVSWQAPIADVPTGAWVDVQHPLSPVSGRHRLVSARIDTTGARVDCAIDAPTGDVPAVTTVKLSSAFEPVIQPGITVEVANGEIIFTARNEQGQPLAGAKITLDGGASRIADASGRVSFAAGRGRHVLRIEAQGYPPAEAEVVV